MTYLQIHQRLVRELPRLGRRFSVPRRIHLVIPSEPGVEVLGFLEAILVGVRLAGVYSCDGFPGAVVGIGVSWGVGPDVNESSLGARSTRGPHRRRQSPWRRCRE